MSCDYKDISHLVHHICLNNFLISIRYLNKHGGAQFDLLNAFKHVITKRIRPRFQFFSQLFLQGTGRVLRF